MLGWLFPRSPIGPVEKAWVETHMLWLSEQFGLPRLLDAQVVPANQIVREDYDGTLENARGILSRLCEPLPVATEQYRLDVVAKQCSTDSEEGDSEQDRPMGEMAETSFGLAMICCPTPTRLPPRWCAS